MPWRARGGSLLSPRPYGEIAALRGVPRWQVFLPRPTDFCTRGGGGCWTRRQVSDVREASALRCQRGISSPTPIRLVHPDANSIQWRPRCTLAPVLGQTQAKFEVGAAGEGGWGGSAQSHGEAQRHLGRHGAPTCTEKGSWFCSHARQRSVKRNG